VTQNANLARDSSANRLVSAVRDSPVSRLLDGLLASATAQLALPGNLMTLAAGHLVGHLALSRMTTGRG